MRILDLLSVLRAARYGVTLFGLLVASATLVAYHAREASFRAADERAMRLLELQASLESAIGYAGLIHNFKNYVLRGGDGYRRAAIRNYADATAALDALEKELGSAASLRTVRAMLGEYRMQIDVAEVAIRRGERPHGIDPLVKVDDSQPAVVLRDLLAPAVSEARRRRDVLMRKHVALTVSVVLAIWANVLLTLALARRGNPH